MKSTFFKSAALVAAVLLSACGGGNAQAAPLPFNFTDTSGTNFSIANASAIEKTGSTIAVTTMAANADGVTVPVSTGYADSNGTVWAKLQATFSSSGLYLRVGTSNRYIGAQAVKYTYCVGSSSILFYGIAKTEANESINDGCAITQGIKALSN